MHSPNSAKTRLFQISGFWADYGQTAPYCLLLRPESPYRGPLDVAIDRFELNGKIELHGAPGHQCSGNAANGSIMLHSVAAFHCNRRKSGRPRPHNVSLSTFES